MIVRWAVAATAALATVPAQAQWLRAESTNYIAYSDGSEADLKGRVTELEKFGQVLQQQTGARRPKDVPVKITVFFLPNRKAVADSLPYPAGSVAGYYNTTLRGPYAVMPRREEKDAPGAFNRLPTLSSGTVLRHELTHHFMYQYFPAAYPKWYSEGFADYMGSVPIGADDVARFGQFLDDRALALREGEWTPLDRLLRQRPGDRINGFAYYSQGWILVHYLNRDDAGRAKLRAYLAAINRGETFEKAMQALGDIDQLDRDVRAYALSDNLPGTATRYLNLDPGQIAVRRLSPVESELVPVELSLFNGVLVSDASGFARRVRAVAAKAPEDRYAMRLLVEAERLAGNRTEANALVDRWLTRHPDDPWATYAKGAVEIDALVAARSTDDAAYERARARMADAIRRMPNVPAMLAGYYDSWDARGVLPPARAQNALVTALDLIPNERTLRHTVALDYERRGLIEDAISTIAPDAYGRSDESPQDKTRRERMQKRYAVAGEKDIETAREMLVRLEGKRDAAKPAPAS